MVWRRLGREKRWKREEVAGARRAVGDQCEDFGDEALLYARFLRTVSVDGHEMPKMIAN